MKKTPLRSVSKKRRVQVNKYLKLRREYLEEHEICQICKLRLATQIHHMASRRGEMIYDVRFFLSTCQQCHSWVHAHPKEAEHKGYILR